MSHGKNDGKRPGSLSKKPGALKLGAKPKSKNLKIEKKSSRDFDFSDQPKRHSPRNSTPEPGARLHQRLGEFVIERISHDGRGLTQWQSKTLFVEGALPGETVTARFISEHRNFAEA